MRAIQGTRLIVDYLFTLVVLLYLTVDHLFMLVVSLRVDMNCTTFEFYHDVVAGLMIVTEGNYVGRPW